MKERPLSSVTWEKETIFTQTCLMSKLSLIVLFFLIRTSLSAQEIALTFDDAPTSDGPLYSGPERTTRILNHLRKHRIGQVAFFVITNNINAAGRERLLRYAADGHLLANHTHQHQSIESLGVKGYNKGIQKADSILKTFKGFTPWFRYPFLDEGKTKPVRDSIRAQLLTLGLTNGYVTVDNYDWYINGLLRKAINEKKSVNYERLRDLYVDHIWKSIHFYDSIGKQVLGRSPKHVLLLHENDLTATFLGDLIEYIRKQGWKIISPTEAYRDPIASQIPDVLFNGQGRIAAIAREQGVPARNLVQDSEDEAYLEELVSRKKIFEK